MRYLPLSDADRADMLAAIGAASVDELFADLPADRRLAALPNLPLHMSEPAVARRLGALAARNTPASSTAT